MSKKYNFVKKNPIGTLVDAVVLPPGESIAAWVACHCVDFYKDVSAIWKWILATAADVDPSINIEGKKFRPDDLGFSHGDVEYRWSSEEVSAPEYVTRALQWIGDQINDETKFPRDTIDEAEARSIFQTPSFAALCGQIFRRIFRVYGILLTTFSSTVETIDGMTIHLNMSFKHFMFFCMEFDIVSKEEMDPFEELMQPLRKEYRLSKSERETSV
eukprot:CAMPEP_0183716662 /NCGR_PEP_ID=MMETSP0737-20130205/10484_1 /TAXON_ID=385413 /ORGANISM="Thalassiosira miniscula, Strain CCMP1093" /LENGTH=214 /DNA_ID=CAMNT_0025945957 /DNA_START=346 /DNA_END=990 /DNA_ORIENTATION=-